MDTAALKRHIDNARKGLDQAVTAAEQAAKRTDAANSPGYADARKRVLQARGVRKMFDALLADCTQAGLMDLFRDANGQPRNDSQTLLYAARQLEYVYSEVEREEFRELPMANGTLLPIDTSVPEGARTFIWYLFSSSGVAQFAAPHNAGTIPLVHLEQAEQTGRVQDMVLGYGYSTKELRAASYARLNLEAEKGIACRRGHEQLANDTGMWGEESLNLPGLFNHPNISVYDAAATGTGNSTLWSLKTPAQIVADVAFAVNTPRRLSFNREQVNRVLIAETQFDLIATTTFSTTGDNGRTILEHLEGIFAERMGRPKVEFMPLFELESANSDGNLASNCLFAYTFDPRVASLVMPMPYTQRPPQERDLFISVPAESSIGGVKMSRPLSCLMLQGIG